VLSNYYLKKRNMRSRTQQNTVNCKKLSLKMAP